MTTRFRYPVLVAAVVPLAVLASEGLAQWWMRPGSAETDQQALTYRFPEERPGARREAITPSVRDILACSDGITGTLIAEDGARLSVSFFEWNHEEQEHQWEAFGHAPDECMHVAGHQFEERYPVRLLSVGGETLAFDASRFTTNEGETVVIFKAPWAPGFLEWAESVSLFRGHSHRRFKINAALHRFRPEVARVLMVSVTGADDVEEAWQFVLDQVVPDLSMQPLPSS